ncbi:RES domain-containing protein [Salmonella enterica]|nr:RES domain-containing protein [Salmonella enterica]EBU0534360.1 RES domain-containing protein [Salmonella enterica]
MVFRPTKIRVFMSDEKTICHQCIGEKYVKTTIKNTGTTIATCSFCEKRRKNLPLQDIVGMMHHVFENYYQSQENNGYSWMDGGDSAQIVIGNELIVDEDIANDIYDGLCESYNRYDDCDPAVYNDDYIYSSRGFSTGKLNQAWHKMKQSLNEEARFFNRSVKLFLDDLFSDLDDFKIGNEQSPIKIIDQNIQLYRARVFENNNEIGEALMHPERNFGPPPPELARSGRMNAHGISVFYGATTPDIAISEVRPPVGSRVIVAPFVSRKPLRILDISALDSLIFSRESIFNPATIKSLEKTAFLKTFSRKMTLPVFGKRQDREYLITQAIAEYLSISKKYRLDGISFRSTQVRKKSKGRQHTSEAGYNVVLFSKSSGVMYSEENERLYKVNLMSNLEHDAEYFNPSIHLIEDERDDKNTWIYTPFKNKEKTLELITSGLTYYKIEGVSYQKTKTEIEQGLPVKNTLPIHSHNIVPDIF